MSAFFVPSSEPLTLEELTHQTFDYDEIAPGAFDAFSGWFEDTDEDAGVHVRPEDILRVEADPGFRIFDPNELDALNADPGDPAEASEDEVTDQLKALYGRTVER